MRKIKIACGNTLAVATLKDNKTSDAIWKALPIEGTTNRWGDEIYFSIPIKIQPENPKEVVELGDIAYWPPGTAFCIFFGRTPVSTENEIKPASPVNVFGKIDGDVTVFKDVKDGSKAYVDKTD